MILLFLLLPSLLHNTIIFYQRSIWLKFPNYHLRWSSRDLPGLQISMIWVNVIVCMIWAGIQSSLPPISLTVLTLTPKKYPWDLWRTTLTITYLFQCFILISSHKIWPKAKWPRILGSVIWFRLKYFWGSMNLICKKPLSV